ncbi:ADC synthase [Calocera viscosa TUFC12733]|uniref:aminodeoxychorismate synthase n=1 Tax=Calocera viscosa (strain TUFC12733) TaxID=1330018 RepID=A0A167QEM2_CALVF|nr:ADC synthase [Calocera viscosa TUFC12733]
MICMGVGVIIDCYDSYTNNLLPCLNTANLPQRDFEEYLRDNVAVIRLHTFEWQFFRDHILPRLDWIIISPGPGRPDNNKDFGFCAELLRCAEIPILGVCLGHQGIGYAHGGRIIPSVEAMHGRTVVVHNTGGGIFENVPAAEMVRYNSLCIDPRDVPTDVQVTAWSRYSDSSSIEIMAVQHRTRPQFGVQFHLESTCSDHDASYKIMKNFASIVARARENKGPGPSSLPEVCKSASYIDFSRPGLSLGDPLKDFIPPLRVLTQKLDMHLSPAALFGSLLRESGDSVGVNAFWLDSARTSQHDPLSRFSFLGTTNRCIRYDGQKIYMTIGVKDVTLRSGSRPTFWAWLESLQHAIQSNVTHDPTFSPDFQCGLVGYFGYELGKESLEGYEPVTKMDTVASSPLSEFMIADKALVFDHRTEAWFAVALIQSSSNYQDTELSHILPCSLGISETEFSCWTRDLESAMPASLAKCGDLLPDRFEFSRTRESYCAAIRRLIQHIGDGDSYEMNLTGQFTGILPAQPTLTDIFALYSDIRTRNPATYSSLMSFAKTRTHILSTSPELFLQLSGDDGTSALMKPIKGTLRRTPCRCDPCIEPAECEASRAREDEQRLAVFAADPKERAENLMIVDLIKADLQNFCHTSSVKVQKLMDVEASETVYSLVTSVEGKLVPGVGPVEAIRRSFPPGSMTGAPKLRSVELLEQLEEGQPRGIYSGCLGYISVNNRASFNVVIRTLVIRDSIATVGAGGAITWLSNVDNEWDEVLLKARSVLQGRI